MKRLTLTPIIALVALLAVAACETIEGAGQDIENTGDAISDGAQDVQAEM
jgi:predicted small secreted protein